MDISCIVEMLDGHWQRLYLYLFYFIVHILQIGKSQKKVDKKSGEPPKKKKKQPELSLREEIEMELAGEETDAPEVRACLISRNTD